MTLYKEQDNIWLQFARIKVGNVINAHFAGRSPGMLYQNCGINPGV